MAGFPIRQYQPGGEFVVVREMDYGPRHFEAGDVFPWRDMGIHEALVQMLWKAVRIEVKRDPVEGAAVVVAPAPPAPVPPPAPAAQRPPTPPTPPLQQPTTQRPPQQQYGKHHNQHRR